MSYDPHKAKLWLRGTLWNKARCFFKGHYWQPQEYDWSIATTFNCWRCGLTKEGWFGPWHERKATRTYYPTTQQEPKSER